MTSDRCIIIMLYFDPMLGIGIVWLTLLDLLTLADSSQQNDSN
jgi:hypothetical protein